MKSMLKKHMILKNQVTHVKAERDVMAEADDPWIVKLMYSFQVLTCQSCVRVVLYTVVCGDHALGNDFVIILTSRTNQVSRLISAHRHTGVDSPHGFLTFEFST